MMSKTHLSIGLATAVAVTRPTTWTQCLAAIIGGIVGGIVPDNDSLDHDSSDALKGQLTAASVAAACFLVDGFLGLGICQAVAERGDLAIIGSLAFGFFYLIGIFCRHRGFTHSIACLALYTAAVYFIYPPLAWAFGTAYGSHLVLDLMNKRTMPIFFPLPHGICLNLCYADRVANRALCRMGHIAAGVLLAKALFESWQGV